MLPETSTSPDTNNQRIRRVDAASDIITTAAGNGDPSGLGDGKGTYSGDGGAAISAGLSLPYAVAFDLSGNMFIRTQPTIVSAQ